MKLSLAKAVIVATTLAALGAACTSTPAKFDSEETGKTLYQRLDEMAPRPGEPKLNGTYRIVSIVSDVVDRLNKNQVIMANPKVMRISQQVMPGHKYEFSSMVLEMAGGPQAYQGRRLDEAHRHLGISEAEWQAMMKDFDDVLGLQGCPAGARRDFLNLIESTRPNVVMGP